MYFRKEIDFNDKNAQLKFCPFHTPFNNNNNNCPICQATKIFDNKMLLNGLLTYIAGQTKSNFFEIVDEEKIISMIAKNKDKITTILNKISNKNNQEKTQRTITPGKYWKVYFPNNLLIIENFQNSNENMIGGETKETKNIITEMQNMVLDANNKPFSELNEQFKHDKLLLDKQDLIKDGMPPQIDEEEKEEISWDKMTPSQQKKWVSKYSDFFKRKNLNNPVYDKLKNEWKQINKEIYEQKIETDVSMKFKQKKDISKKFKEIIYKTKPIEKGIQELIEIITDEEHIYSIEHSFNRLKTNDFIIEKNLFVPKWHINDEFKNLLLIFNFNNNTQSPQIPIWNDWLKKFIKKDKSLFQIIVDKLNNLKITSQTTSYIDTHLFLEWLKNCSCYNDNKKIVVYVNLYNTFQSLKIVICV